MPTKLVDFNLKTSIAAGDQFVGPLADGSNEYRVGAQDAIGSMLQFVAPVWNNGPTEFDGIAIDVTDTASAVGSRLIRARIGGVEKFTVRKDSRIRYGPDASNHWTHLVSATGDLALTGVGSTGGAFSVTPAAGKHFNVALSAGGIMHLVNDGSRIQTGSNVVGAAANVGSTENSDGGALKYRAYFSYDCYWDEVTDQWRANRTTLGRKWLMEMSQQSAAFKIRYFDGTVSSPWADSAWSDFFQINSAGNIGVGTVPLARLHVISTTEQFRLGYDASNYWKKTVGSSGGLTMAGVGAGGSLTVVPTAGQNATITLSAGGRLILTGNINRRTSTAADPTTAEYPNSGDYGTHKNTTSGNLFLAANDGGAIKKVALT